MKKYFVVSDIHGFYEELREGLKNAGFKVTNKEHILIVCGDIFDRGSEPLKVYKFLKSLPKYRRILIRGNHESLLLDLLNKPFPERHDFSNKTVDTVFDVVQMPIELLNSDTYDYNHDRWFKGSRKAWKDAVEAFKKSSVYKFLTGNDWVDYYELDNYIFVHSFIPTDLKPEILEQYGALAYIYDNAKMRIAKDDWRNASSSEWEQATWGCPWELYSCGLFDKEEKQGKTLVCGHWHTSDFYYRLKGETCFMHSIAPIYFSKGLIGIDGGVMYDYIDEKYIHPQNVLIIEDGVCYTYDKGIVKLVEFKNSRIIETVTVSEE